MDMAWLKLLGLGSIGSGVLSAVTSVSADTLVPMGVVIGGMILVGMLAWRLATVLAKLQSRLDQQHTRLDQLEHRLNKREYQQK